MEPPPPVATPEPPPQEQLNGRRRSFFYPRWSVLGAQTLVISAIIGLLLKLYYEPRPTSSCPFGPICQAETWPGVVQVVAIWVGFVFFTVLWLGFGNPFLESGSDDQRADVSRVIITFLRKASDFMPNQALLMWLASIAVLGILGMWYLDRLAPLPFAFAVVVIYVATLVTFYDPRDRLPQTASGALRASNRRLGNPFNFFRTLPFINHVAPLRPVSVPDQQQPPPGPTPGGPAPSGPGNVRPVPPQPSTGGTTPPYGPSTANTGARRPFDPNDTHI
jgi:hypothetical protein